MISLVKAGPPNTDGEGLRAIEEYAQTLTRIVRDVTLARTNIEAITVREEVVDAGPH